jgi:hypothetical protein
MSVVRSGVVLLCTFLSITSRNEAGICARELFRGGGSLQKNLLEAARLPE